MYSQFAVSTRSRSSMEDITAYVQDAVTKSGIGDGFCVVFVPHTSAGVTINEHADPDVGTDILAKLEELVPRRGAYRHTEDGNADAHIKASLMGSSVTVLVHEGRLRLGVWQGVFLCEFDGPRRRSVWVQVVGS